MQAARLGKVAELGTAVPTTPSDSNRVRATLLRFLVLGGDAQTKLEERGLRLRGAFVEGALDLQGCEVPSDLMLWKCYFPGPVSVQHARSYGLIALDGCHLQQGLNADGLRCEGGMLLRNGFVARAEVRLLRAQIGADLDCSDGIFESATGNALSADGATIKGSLLLSQGFKATAPIRLHGIQVHGSFSCRRGSFTSAGIGLATQGAEVKGHWHFDDLAAPVRADARGMRVGTLVDDVSAWCKGSVLDGFTYAAIGGRAPTNAQQRVNWLNLQSPEDLGETDKGDESFRPQPWRHLQRVLREMGHTEDARQIGIAYEKRLRHIGRIGESPEGTLRLVATLKRHTATSLHWLFGVLAGYGYRPLRLLAWLLGVWLVSAALFWWWALPPHNALAPSDPLIFQHPVYAACQPDQTEPAKPPANWYLCSPLRGEYATFSPLAFSADILLPVVDLGQEKTWGAFVPTPKENWAHELFVHWHPGHWVRLLIWFETLFGWVCSLLLIAIVSGFARRSEE